MQKTERIERQDVYARITAQIAADLERALYAFRDPHKHWPSILVITLRVNCHQTGQCPGGKFSTGLRPLPLHRSQVVSGIPGTLPVPWHFSQGLSRGTSIGHLRAEFYHCTAAAHTFMMPARGRTPGLAGRHGYFGGVVPTNGAGNKNPPARGHRGLSRSQPCER